MYLKKIALISFFLTGGWSSSALANAYHIHGVGGFSWVDMGGRSSVDLGFVTDQFDTFSQTKTSALWGYGVGYEWDFSNKPYPFLFDLSLTGYYTHSHLSGTETPATNLIHNAEPLNYAADATNWSWLVEPKFISNRYAWQPYFMFGLGFSNNQADHYVEVPSNPASSAVAVNSFSSNTATQFAWEVGAALQHELWALPKGGKLIIAAEYRYMDWGPLTLGTTPAQTSSNQLNLGHYQSNIFDFRLNMQF